MALNLVAEPDFPLNPAFGEKYTTPAGLVYLWDGEAWTNSLHGGTLNNVLYQIRVLLQDTDLHQDQGVYRYSNESLIMNINQGLTEMYRIRPDIFLELGFKVPNYNLDLTANAEIKIESQHIPALIYYAVGMAQLRDDEPTQDTRASSFLAKFTSMLAAVA